ncbi:MAG: hypothetical protein JF614_07265 [Acidobacteria bacterium]|nr:hypothetical protein [Acidobacteriota bacterium]
MSSDLVQVRTTPDEVIELARQRRVDGRVWTKLQRFFRRHCQPGTKFEDVDFRTSVVVLPADEQWRLRGHLHCTPYLDSAGLLVRSGLSAPYVSGPSIGLPSAAVEDPELQRARCLPLTRASHLQTTSELKRRLRNGEETHLKEDLECALAMQGDEQLLDHRHLGPRRLNQLGEDFENAVFQGAGDLSFNEWNVAFCNDANGKRCFMPEGEPVSDRTYRCLVVFKPGSRLGDFKSRAARFGAFIGDSLAVLELRVLRGHPWLLLPPERCNAVPTDCIEFAIFGKSILWEGDVVKKSTIVEQFRDIRHVFLLPDVSKAKDTRQSPVFTGFGYDTSGSFWLLEAALRKNSNLARLACYAPISVPVHELGATRHDIEAQLGESKYYQACESPRAVRRAGQYCLHGKELYIYLRASPYPCTILAIGSQVPDKTESESLYLLAFGHEVALGEFRGGFRLWEDCAQILKGLGARYALGMDEGFDVFQLLLRNAGHKKAFEEVEECASGDVEKSIAETRSFFTVPPAFKSEGGQKLLLRRAMRATLAFWRAPL